MQIGKRERGLDCFTERQRMKPEDLGKQEPVALRGLPRMGHRLKQPRGREGELLWEGGAGEGVVGDLLAHTEEPLSQSRVNRCRVSLRMFSFFSFQV